MHRLRVSGLVVVSIAITLSGCTSFTSSPTINERVEPGIEETISSFTYEIDSPWKDSRFGKSAYEATQKNIPYVKGNSSKLVATILPTLEIKVSESSSGGACGQEYLTGLSLGLIPSWCTRPNLFKFDFMLSDNHGFCRRKVYSISSITFSHLTLIPFAMLSDHNQPLTMYQVALKDFLRKDQCIRH